MDTKHPWDLFWVAMFADDVNEWLPICARLPMKRAGEVLEQRELRMMKLAEEYVCTACGLKAFLRKNLHGLVQEVFHEDPVCDAFNAKIAELGGTDNGSGQYDIYDIEGNDKQRCVRRG